MDDIQSWMIGLIYLSPLLLLIGLIIWAVLGIIRKQNIVSIVDRYLIGLTVACFCLGALFSLLHLMSLASSFEFPGEAWANMLLPPAVSMIPVLWLILHRYQLLRSKEAYAVSKQIKKTTFTISFAWFLLILLLSGFAFSDWSPTTYAMREYPAFAKTLIDAKIAINKRDYNGYTPLGIAIQAGDAATVKRLIEQGADVNLEIIVRQPRTSTRYTPLKWAAVHKKSNAEIIALLHQSGAKE